MLFDSKINIVLTHRTHSKVYHFSSALTGSFGIHKSYIDYSVESCKITAIFL